MATSGPLNSDGNYLAITDAYDSEVIRGLDINSPEFKDYLVYLQTTITNQNFFINNKPSAALNPTEQVSCKTLFSPNTTSINDNSNLRRQLLWVSVLVGPINMGANLFPHNIPDVDDSNFMGIYLYGSVTDPIAFHTISLPYAGPLGTICLEYDDTNLIVTASFDASSYTQGLVTIEYVKY